MSDPVATPTPSISAGELVERLKTDRNKKAQEISPEEADNKARALREISSIFELKKSPAFDWFFDEFVVKPYQLAFDALKSPDAPRRRIDEIRQRYVALREVRAGLLEREILHREQLGESGSEIARLREELAAL